MSEKKKYIKIKGMHCAGCVSNVEKTLGKLPGVSEVTVSLSLHQARVTLDTDICSDEHLQTAVRKIGYSIESIKTASSIQMGEPIEDSEQPSKTQDSKEAKTHPNTSSNAPFDSQLHADKKSWRNQCILSLVLSMPILIHMFWQYETYIQPSWIVHSAWFLLTSIIWAWCGRSFLLGCIRSIRTRTPSMDTLVGLGTSLAFMVSVIHLVGYYLGINFSLTSIPFVDSTIESGASTTPKMPPLYFETTAMLITIILLGRWMEAIAREKASHSYKTLETMLPEKAMWLKRPKNSEHLLQHRDIEEIPIQELPANAYVKVLPGMQSPVDGTVVAGASWVNESMITGESTLKEVFKDAYIYAGSINTSGTLIIQADKPSDQTMLSQMIQMVEQTQLSKIPIQRLADKVAAWVIPIILSLALATGIIWLIVTGIWHWALIPVISILLITCPCAIGLAAPLAMLVGVTQAVKLGIVFKEAAIIELLPKITTLFTDKTGTLTYGKPRLEGVWSHPEWSEEEILRYAYTMEYYSEHPFAVAFKEHVPRGLEMIDLEDVTILPGKGLEAIYKDQRYKLGSITWMQEQKIDLLFAETFVRTHIRQGHQLIFCAKESQLIGCFAMADTVRNEAMEVIDFFKEHGIAVLLLTGDAQPIAKTVGTLLGIHRVYPELLPADKAALIKERQENTGYVAMLGDGLNDAPALKIADIGIAVSTGTDLSKEAADIVILNEGIVSVAHAYLVAQQIVHTIRLNLFWAFIYNAVCIPIAAGILVPFLGIGFMMNPMLAALAMGISSVMVVLNSLLLPSRINRQLKKLRF